jgi:hypothetical protein
MDCPVIEERFVPARPASSGRVRFVELMTCESVDDRRRKKNMTEALMRKGRSMI